MIMNNIIAANFARSAIAGWRGQLLRRVHRGPEGPRRDQPRGGEA